MVTAPGPRGITQAANGRSYPEFGFFAFCPKKVRIDSFSRGFVTDRYGKHKPHPVEIEGHGPPRLRRVWVGACAADSLGAGDRSWPLAPLAPLPGVRVELRLRPRRA